MASMSASRDGKRSCQMTRMRACSLVTPASPRHWPLAFRTVSPSGKRGVTTEIDKRLPLVLPERDAVRACGPEHQLVPDLRPRGRLAFGGFRWCVRLHEHDAHTDARGQGSQHREGKDDLRPKAHMGYCDSGGAMRPSRPRNSSRINSAIISQRFNRSIKLGRAGKANGSRECAPDDRLRVLTIPVATADRWWARRNRAFAHPRSVGRRSELGRRPRQQLPVVALLLPVHQDVRGSAASSCRR